MSIYLYVNLTTASCCLLFLIFLIFSYFSKKNMNNIENKIYRRLLIINVLCVISYILFYVTDMICYYSLDQSKLYPIVYIFSKLSPIFAVAWAAFFVFYLVVITNELNNKFTEKLKHNEKKYFAIVYLYIIITSVFQIFEHKTINLATGVETTIIISMNIAIYLCLLTNIVLIIKNRKKISKKKVLPALTILPITFIAILFALINVPIILLFIIMTVINHLMFHTIENPDVKLINELELARDQAQRANNAKTDFLSSMSHELRTPLNSIIGLTSVIKNTTDINEIYRDIDDISLSSQKLLELVDGILEVNKLDSNEISIIENNYHFSEIISNLSDKVKLRIGEKPIQFKMRISEDIPNILYGDKEKIKLIINNLLSNAIKYTDEGTVELSVDCLNTKDKCNLRISVSDTGRGIKEEDIDNIFNKFYRSAENKDSDISGTGLGLSITKSLVELMDGKINVNSNEGIGTTFLVTISQKIIEIANKVVETEIL